MTQHNEWLEPASENLSKAGLLNDGLMGMMLWGLLGAISLSDM